MRKISLFLDNTYYGEKMKYLLATLFVFMTISTFVQGASVNSYKGLNSYCDPAETMYAGGTPLFNEATGRSESLDDYLAKKGLNEYCDPAETMYAGGTPLFNEATGRNISIEDYLKNKTLRVYQ